MAGLTPTQMETGTSVPQPTTKSEAYRHSLWTPKRVAAASLFTAIIGGGLGAVAQHSFDNKDIGAADKRSTVAINLIETMGLTNMVGITSSNGDTYAIESVKIGDPTAKQYRFKVVDAMIKNKDGKKVHQTQLVDTVTDSNTGEVFKTFTVTDHNSEQAALHELAGLAANEPTVTNQEK